MSDQWQPQDSGPHGVTKRSGMATFALVCGVLSFLCPILIFGILAIIFGIVAISAINKNPGLSGKGLAIAGLVSGCISLAVVPFIALLVAILLPSLSKARELSNRSVCAANIRSIVQSMAVYAADNNDRYPIVSKTGGFSLAAGGSGAADSDLDAATLSMYKSPGTPSVTQNMWLLVLGGQVSPKQFICKSDPAPTVSASVAPVGTYQVNFNDGTPTRSDFSYSYSFAYPWTTDADAKVGDWWHNETDSGLPVIGDMSPLEGTGSPAATPNIPINRAANSFTHQRDGQNIGFGDAHAEFARRPDVGHSNDNVYTYNGGVPSPNGTSHRGGIPGILSGGKPGAYDICLVPVADANAGYTRK